ncbi:MAG: cytoplasmic protein [Desulfobulbales bacterium]
MSSSRIISAHNIVFGLNRAEDERSLADFLRLFSTEELLPVLIPRMTDDEIQQIVQLLSAVMRSHLTNQEYHSLFLADRKNSH